MDECIFTDAKTPMVMRYLLMCIFSPTLKTQDMTGNYFCAFPVRESVMEWDIYTMLYLLYMSIEM